MDSRVSQVLSLQPLMSVRVVLSSCATHRPFEEAWRVVEHDVSLVPALAFDRSELLPLLVVTVHQIDSFVAIVTWAPE